MKRLLPLCLGVCLILPSFSAESTASPGERVEEFHTTAPGDFSKLAALGEEFDFDHIDLALPDAAVFHETNRHRKEQGVRPPPGKINWPGLAHRPSTR